MKLEEFERDGGKPSPTRSCDNRLPCHYRPKVEATTTIAHFGPIGRRNPDSHLGAAEDTRWNESGIELTERDREILRDAYGFRLPEHYQKFRDNWMD